VRWRFGASLLAVAGIGLASGAAAPAAAPPSKCITDYDDATRPTFFRELRRLGVRTWGSGINWPDVVVGRPRRPRDPNDPAYHWSAALDRQVARSVANGIEPVLHVNGAPEWANGGRSTQWAPRPSDYASFMVAAMRHYSRVRRWQVFAEPSNPVNFLPQGRNGARLYARILDAAYAAMHGVRRDAVVIGATLHPSGNDAGYGTSVRTWLREMRLPSGSAPRMDLFGINPYTERAVDVRAPLRPGRVDIDDLDWLVGRLDRIYPGRRLRLFISEFGWNTEHGAIGWGFYVSRAEQATRLRRSYALARRLGRVDTLCWYQLYDAPPDTLGGYAVNWTSGLRLFRGGRKPAYRAFARIPAGPARVGRAVGP
jgi:hypothetical protein